MRVRVTSNYASYNAQGFQRAAAGIDVYKSSDNTIDGSDMTGSALRRFISVRHDQANLNGRPGLCQEVKRLGRESGFLSRNAPFRLHTSGACHS